VDLIGRMCHGRLNPSCVFLRSTTSPELSPMEHIHDIKIQSNINIHIQQDEFQKYAYGRHKETCESSWIVKEGITKDFAMMNNALAKCNHEAWCRGTKCDAKG
jgi:hypothetical protein